MSIQLTVFNAQTMRSCSVYLPPSTTVADAIPHILTRLELPPSSQASSYILSYNGVELIDTARTLRDYGITAAQNTLFIKINATSAAPAPAPSASPTPFNAADLSSRILQGLRQAALQQRGLMDEDDPEVQRRLLEQIEKANIDANLEQGLEYNPEGFGRVVMLYVNCEVNRTPMCAFIDSGAQMSVMSRSCAERCGIMRLVDTRFRGVARGVGTTPILGRVHVTLVKLAGLVLPFTITVLDKQEQDIDFIIGLDQLRRHQMCIDLGKNVLRVEGAEVPFLGEGELPKHLKDEVESAEEKKKEVEGTPAAPAAAPDEDKLSALMEATGCDREVALGVLEATEWDVEAAITLMTS